jgi:hypothetical protein
MLRAATTRVLNNAGIPQMPVLTRNGDIMHVASGERFPRNDASPDMEVVVPGEADVHQGLTQAQPLMITMKQQQAHGADHPYSSQFDGVIYTLRRRSSKRNIRQPFAFSVTSYKHGWLDWTWQWHRGMPRRGRRSSRSSSTCFWLGEGFLARPFHCSTRRPGRPRRTHVTNRRNVLCFSSDGYHSSCIYSW